jgi:hypothetical protein
VRHDPISISDFAAATPSPAALASARIGGFPAFISARRIFFG